MAQLSATARKFVRDWGELGDRWGLDRSAAEVHALLYISAGGLTEAEVAATLKLDPAEARTAIETLHEWKVVRSASLAGGAPAKGSERWECEPDVVVMFRAILEARRRRELDPAAAVVRDCVLRAESDSGAEPHMVKRLEEMQELLRLVGGFYTAIGTLPSEPTRRLLKLGQKIRQSLGA